MKNFGIAVDLRKKNGERYILRNVTEIHYNYKSAATDLVYVKKMMGGIQIAFESSIHQNGFTMPFSDVHEFETYLETEKQPAF